MLLYCRGDAVLATHDDNQTVAPAAYGDGVFVIPVASLADLPRIGEAPAAGEPDALPLAVPAPTEALLKAYAAQKRFMVETGGIDVGGSAVATDRGSQGMLTGAYVQAVGDSNFTTNWKQPDGTFAAVDAATIMAIGQAVLAHVSACFTAESQAVAAIVSGAATAWSDVDAFFDALT